MGDPIAYSNSLWFSGGPDSLPPNPSEFAHAFNAKSCHWDCHVGDSYELYSQLECVNEALGLVFLGWTSTKLGLMFFLKDTAQWRWWGSSSRPSVSSQALFHWATALPNYHSFSIKSYNVDIYKNLSDSRLIIFITNKKCSEPTPLVLDTFRCFFLHIHWNFQLLFIMQSAKASLTRRFHWCPLDDTK